MAAIKAAAWQIWEGGCSAATDEDGRVAGGFPSAKAAAGTATGAAAAAAATATQQQQPH